MLIVPEGHSQRTELHRLAYTVLEIAVGAEESLDGKGLASPRPWVSLVSPDLQKAKSQVRGIQRSPESSVLSDVSSFKYKVFNLLETQNAHQTRSI